MSVGRTVAAAAEHVPVAADVELVLLRVGEVDKSALDPGCLDPSERARADALRHPDDRASYVAAHLLLRDLLGARLGVAPADVSYGPSACPACGGPHGRPTLRAEGEPVMQFSLTRRRGLALVALAERPVGVDLERVPDAGTVAAVCDLLHPRERDAVLATAPHERAQVFARLWTRKEAYLKAVGVGIATDLDREPVGVATPSGWTITEPQLHDDYVGAVALSPAGLTQAVAPA